MRAASLYLEPVSRGLSVAALMLCLLFVALLPAGLATSAEEYTGDYHYPQQRQLGAHRALIHMPQIRSWPDFSSFRGLLAMEFFAEGESTPLYATAIITGPTELDMDHRSVTTLVDIETVLFAGPHREDYVDEINSLVTGEPMVIPLETFLAFVADDLLSVEQIAVIDKSSPVIFHTASAQLPGGYQEARDSGQPVERIRTDGEPRLQAIEQAGGLAFVENTDSALFRLGDTWYFMTAARWFSSDDLAQRRWRYVEVLPANFAQIPADHAAGYIRPWVPGTPEAKMAILEASLYGAELPPVPVEEFPLPVARSQDDPPRGLYASGDGAIYRETNGTWYRFDAQSNEWIEIADPGLEAPAAQSGASDGELKPGPETMQPLNSDRNTQAEQGDFISQPMDSGPVFIVDVTGRRWAHSAHDPNQRSRSTRMQRAVRDYRSLRALARRPGRG